MRWAIRALASLLRRAVAALGIRGGPQGDSAPDAWGEAKDEPDENPTRITYHDGS